THFFIFLMADKNLQDQITELEKEISTTKYNKRTQGAIGALKAKLALLKQKSEKRASSGVGKSTDGYAVRKTGDGSVVLLGFPSAGKSTLLNSLTNADSPVGAYAFTTLSVVPGVLKYKHAKIQILDVPGIISGAASGQGRGKEVLQVIRSADFVCIVIDVFNPQQYHAILKEVRETGVRLNKRKPDVKVRKTIKNGIRVGATVSLKNISEEEIQNICKAFKIVNADILIRTEIDADEFIDILEANKIYLPAIKILNKVDIADPQTLQKAREIVKPDLEISAHTGLHIEELKELIFEKMDLIRIYLKEVGKNADMEEPLIMQKGQTLEDLCMKLHKDFLDKFRFARVWGKSAKFDGQKILKTSHEIADEDIIELHIS
ncbi:MAG: OBG GTPase family GTP-binding protein, partial [Candidatus Woesearchaeota archaeon]